MQQRSDESDHHRVSWKVVTFVFFCMFICLDLVTASVLLFIATWNVKYNFFEPRYSWMLQIVNTIRC